MDPSFNPDMIPWELIAADLQDSLSADQRAQLTGWLESSPGNREVYARLRDVWDRGIAGYPFYSQADPEAGWQALRAQITGSEVVPAGAGSGGHPVADVRTSPADFVRRFSVIRWAAAAVLIVVTGAIAYYMAGRERVYDAKGTVRQVELADGSIVTLRPGCRIRLSKDFARQQRLVFLDRGTAYFEVLHDDDHPFTVRTVAADVRDLGTRFTVTQGADSVDVSVLSGRVAFVSRALGESRELAAGMELTFRAGDHRFGPVALTGYIGDSSRNRLRFENASLSQVTEVLREMTGRPITLENPAVGQRKLSIHLDGESFDDAIKIICSSLDLEYIVKNDTCILKIRHE